MTVNTQDKVLALTGELIERHSVTPDDAGCQEIIAQRLAQLGFTIEHLDHNGVRNLWAHRGDGAPHLMFAGHTDVVPTGPVDQWRSPPFTPTIINGLLYGRGAADMKASLAGMIVAVEHALAESPEVPGTLSFLITSDEEGDALYGTQYAIAELKKRNIKPDYCIVGEPSSSKLIGDVVRCGRRGSLNGALTIKGVQGHVAYPDAAHNPIHEGLRVLDELSAIEWDDGNPYYPPTSLQICNINAGTGATNIIPGELQVLFNLRFNTEQTSAGLEATIEELFDRNGLNYELQWHLSGEPFLTQSGRLTEAVTDAIEKETGLAPELSTSGGTSDGRFISPWGPAGVSRVEVVELGPTNATIHKINECVALAELAPLARIYQQIIKSILT